MKHVLLCTLMLSVIITSASAQEIFLLDQTTLQPITDATITIPSRDVSLLSDAQGKAILPPADAGDTVLFRHLAYQTATLTVAQIRAARGRVLLVERFLHMDEVVIAANRWEEKREEIPQRLSTITAREIAFGNPQTTAILLENLGDVFVQKSQLGGGSPVLRGMEANRVLLVVDGVRMNNAIYRSGHLQSVIALDAAGLDGAEVIFGPGSVMYGSDALGGVMDFHTKPPRYAFDGALSLAGSAFARTATANAEKTGHADISLGFGRFALLTSVTYSDFGDLRSGNIHHPAYGDWGRRPFSVERIGGADSAVRNDNPNVQRGTAYNQLNVLQKIGFRASDDLSAEYGFHYSTTSDIPRYDRLTEPSTVNPAYAEWYYGPQNWMMNSLRVHFDRALPFSDRLRIVAAHQRIDEDRVSRRFRNNNKRHQEEDVTVISVNLDLDKQLDGPARHLFYGAEATFNDVASTAYTDNIVSGVRSPAATRYPSGGSTMNSFAAYASCKWALSDAVELTGGARFSRVALESEFGDTTFYKFPADRIETTNNALNGAVGLVLRPSDDWRFTVNLASGFRAPNVDDVGKLFDSSPGNVIIPNPGLQPEYAYTADAGIEKRFGPGILLSVRAFATSLRDAIVVRDATFNGLDSILYDGRLSRVQAPQNAAEALLHGATADLVADITASLSFAGTITYTYGRDKTNDAPLDHIPPVFGQARIVYRETRFKAECGLRFNAWKHLEEYSPGGEDNLQYATPYGMPGWMTLNLRASYQVFDRLQITAAVENILDEHYRAFASGISAPGRSAVVSVATTW